MYRFLFGRKFLKAVVSLDDKNSKKIWKSLNLLEKDPPPSGLNPEVIKSNKILESCRLSTNFRVIYIRDKSNSLIELLFVGKHDDAYNFAESFKPNASGSALISTVLGVGGASVIGVGLGMARPIIPIPVQAIIAGVTIAPYIKKKFFSREQKPMTGADAQVIIESLYEQ